MAPAAAAQNVLRLISSPCVGASLGTLKVLWQRERLVQFSRQVEYQHFRVVPVS
jgi:hypothetical protein